MKPRVVSSGWHWQRVGDSIAWNIHVIAIAWVYAGLKLPSQGREFEASVSSLS
jgi:hypothetical protein